LSRLLVATLALALAVSGCDGEDEPAPSERKVETTKVEVVEGIGRKGGFDAAEIYERLSPGVVTVISLFDGGGVGRDGGQGSGFVLDGDGFIATNAHVVTSASGRRRPERVFVEFADGQRVPARIVGDDPNADVALLKVDPSGLSLTPLRLGSSKGLDVGEPVAAIGSPFGEQQSLSVGVISALDRNIQSLTRFQIGNAIQTDAAVNPGNSGGPLLDRRGRVLGINAQIRSESGGGEGVGFAIPVDAVRRSLRELRDKGRVDYGFLGVQTRPLYPQLARRLDLPVEQGALIEEVERDSPAAKAGLEGGDDELDFQGDQDIKVGGDVVVEVNGRKVTRRDDLADVIGTMSAGRKVKLELIRDGRRRTLEIELGRRPARR
jgi:S1-C subfamily serine protease